ncbi:molecular chaperone [Pseudomonas eucalypticola]|uniref:Molecular chaperone n=1 Tax=Pseudomonas eucalypticola TaxID=2599595 RepID=A0A7D5H3T6_9PSED|nr:molecular chaperone [Pseudomonas eucalypticola]QKZ03189.1 molecular chaperone [Pseudomonas eucalypticola]
MKYALLLLGLMSLSVQAGPELNIGSLYDYLDPQRSTSLKKIYNGGDRTAFVKVMVAELVYGADGKATEVSMDGLGVDERALVASPARLIVPAKGMQQVRLLYRGTRDRERYFRLRFIPVLPEINDGFGLTVEEAREYDDSLQAGVSILAGYGAVVFVKPAQARYDTQVVHEPQRFIVPNGGNATVVIDHFNDCSMDGKDCRPPTKHHVLPGRRLVFEKQTGRSYRFIIEEGAQRREEAFDG